MTPVILLSDGYIANGAEPWRVPEMSEHPAHRRCSSAPSREASSRTCATSKLARPWAIPGTPGLEHRIGGLEKENITGNISYDAGEPRADVASCAPSGARRSPSSCRRPRCSATPRATCW